MTRATPPTATRVSATLTRKINFFSLNIFFNNILASVTTEAGPRQGPAPPASEYAVSVRLFFLDKYFLGMLFFQSGQMVFRRT